MKQLGRVLEAETERLADPRSQYDYRHRTRIERSLYALTSAFCRVKFGYALGGLTNPHRRLFSEAAQVNQWDNDAVELVKRAFWCHSELLSLSPTDPSSRGGEKIAPDSTKFSIALHLKSSLCGLSARMTKLLSGNPEL